MKNLLIPLAILISGCSAPSYTASDCANAWLDTGQDLDKMSLSYIDACCSRAYSTDSIVEGQHSSRFDVHKVACKGYLLEYLVIAGPVEREAFCADEQPDKQD